MCEPRYFVCKHCGNLVEMIHASGVPMICCGEPMSELIPGSVDASLEKHVPVVTVGGSLVTVNVGAVTHPMIPEHYIGWIALRTKQGVQRKCLKPGDEPKAVFALAEGDAALTAFAWCNLHGLWKKNI